MRRSAAFLLVLLLLPAPLARAAHARPSSLQFDSGTWIPLAPPDPVPSPRQAGAVAYDPIGEQMILFGGEALNDTWSLDLSGSPTWTQLITAHSPTARSGALMVYDSRRRQMILFGGNQGNSYVNDVWVLNLTGTPDWTPLTPAGSLPTARMAATGMYDPVRDRLLVFAGYPPATSGSTVWALSLGSAPSWDQLGVTGILPSPRWGAVGGYDPENDRFIITSGSATDDPAGTTDVWALSLGVSLQWTLMDPPGLHPQSRFIASAVYDRPNKRFLLFGGFGALGPLSDLWDLEDAGSGAWVSLGPAGPRPSARRNHMAVYDEQNSRMILFGGLNDATVVTNDLWSLQFPPAAPLLPEIDSFEPAGGQVGATVIIHGHHLDEVSGVSFNGVPATVFSAVPLQAQAQVPAGATTGRIRCTSATGFAESATDFFIGDPPVLLGAEPDSGGPRAQILLSGRNFTGATRVSFGGSSPTAFSVTSDTTILAFVGLNGTTGHVTVANPVGSSVGAFEFHVLAAIATPRLLPVRDVPNDQGGRVTLRWEASDFDEPSTGTITSYRVWRRAPAALSASPGDHVQAADYWEPLADLPAAFLPGYAYTAATPFDSTADANPYTAFFVQALTADRLTFYTSNVDSGYSVDNLAPPEPTPFVATYSASQAALHWRASRAADFREFRLYRGMGPSFPLAPQNLLVATQDTGYVDVAAGPNDYSYKLIALDIHGNASRAAMVSPETPVATLASLLSAEANATRIRLAWYSGDAPGALATVYRRQLDGDWQVVAQIVADGSGILRYEDHAIVAGQRYGYRLGIVDGGVVTFAGEVWLTAETPQFSMAAVWPNPASGGRFSVAFDLASAEAASLELWDVAGRRIDRREVGALGAGHHQLEFGGDTRLAPGVYLLRLSSAGRKLSSRVVLLN